ncbi:hypothetical protein [Escherichia coli]|jgi:hypothetical protein|uniref:hypothetical protein n=1 Tax=Escherichia coli TaxID=562 RepID=UPI001FCEC30B|nr:hypothetical protein [Escherichia coli]
MSVAQGRDCVTVTPALTLACEVLPQYRHDASSLNFLCSAFSAMLLSYAQY